MDGFSSAYYLLPSGAQETVREKIKDTCGWRHSTFYAKLNGNTPIKNLKRLHLKPSSGPGTLMFLLVNIYEFITYRAGRTP